MNRTTLLALASRVEAATGADRELDAEIYQALNPHMRPIPNCETWRFFDPAKTNHMTAAKYFLGGNATGVAKSYTASLDAAMSLVPSGLILRNYQSSRFVPHSCEVALSWAHGGWLGNSDHSFALALTAACLRARAMLEQGNG